MTDCASTVSSKRVALLITAVVSFTLPLVVSTVNIALPTMGREFGMEAVVMGWVVTAYILGVAVSQVPFGRLADIRGRKKIFVWGLALFIISSFICAFASSTTLLITFRVLQGIGSGMTFSSSVAILISIFPAGERGRALGITSAAVYIGLAMGPFIGGDLTEHFGWRSIFFLSAFLGLAVTFPVFLGLKGEWAEARGEKFDLFGSIVLSVAIATGIYGFTVLPAVPGIVLVVLGVICLLAFLWWETRVASPIINVGLFRNNTVFVFSNLATLASYSATTAVIFLLSLYLQYTKGLSPQVAGSIWIVQPFVVGICAPMAGRLSDRIEPQRMASFGMAVSFVALLLLAFLTEETGMGFLIAGMAVLGIGSGIFISPNINAIMGSVEKRFLGIASGTIGTMRTIGMMLSLGIVMILFSIYIGEAQITPDTYPAFLLSTRVAFAVLAAICFGGIFAQLAGRRARQA